MGILQPGGAGTPIYIYDDAVNTNHPAAPGPHTFAEINAAFPLDWPILQDPAGNTFSASRRQYLARVITVMGGQSTDGGNYTSLVDTNCDVFSKTVAAAPAFRYRVDSGIAPSHIVTILGTKVPWAGGSFRFSGQAGVGFYTESGVMSWRGTLGLYDCAIYSGGAMVFFNTGSSYQEIGGSLISSAGSISLGLASDGPLRLSHVNLSYRGGSFFVASILISSSHDVIMASSTCSAFVNIGNAANRKLQDIDFVGSCSSSDIAVGVVGGGLLMRDLVWSDTVGKPRISFIGPHAVGTAAGDHRTMDTKVVDHNGNSLQAIPIYLESDVDGAILDTQTGADGNVVFTYFPTQFDNALPVRDYYGDTGVLNARDRVYTMYVNSYKGTFPPNQTFETKVFRFEWPGRDRLGSGYQTDGGSFQQVMDVIALSPGAPSKVTIWNECEV